MRIRTGGIALAAATAALGLGACGSSKTTSGTASADPAAMVPASAPIYFSVTTKPDSSETATLKNIVNEFGGNGTWTKFVGALKKTVTKNDPNASFPWLGQQIGVAFTDVPTSAELNSSNQAPSDLVIVVPTNNPTQAEQGIKQLIKQAGGATFAIKGKYVLFGGAAAVNAAKSASSTLASSSAYSSSVSTDSSTLLSGYVELKPVLTELSNSSMYKQILKSVNYGAELSKLPADASVGLTLKATASAVSFDVKPHDVPQTSASSSSQATVAGLPGDSILALAINFTKSSFDNLSKTFSSGFLQGFNSQLSQDEGGLSSGELGSVQALGTKVLGEIQKTILPALGPLELSFGGSSVTSLHAGLSIASFDQGAADRVLKLLYNEINASGSVQATKTATGFTIQVPPIFNVNISHTAGKIVALLGYTNVDQFLKPSSALSSNSAYTSAVGQLPSGAHVPFFLNFGPLNALVKAVGPEAGAGANLGQVEQVLSHLSYVVLGSGSGGETKFVVGLK